MTTVKNISDSSHFFAATDHLALLIVEKNRWAMVIYLGMQHLMRTAEKKRTAMNLIMHKLLL